MLLRLGIALAVVAVSAALVMWWRRREGRFSEESGRFDRTDLGLGRRDKPGAVLVEFFGRDCAPCVTVQERLEKIAAAVPDVRVVSIDAGERMEVAERYGVRRVPTLFVADSDLNIRWRASGVPSEDAIGAALLGPEWAGRPHPLPATSRPASR